MLAMNIKQEQTIREVVKRFKAALSGFTESAKGRECEVDEVYFSHAVSRAATHYARNYVKSYAFMQIFGSPSLTTLLSIYISQRLKQAHTSVRSFESVDELEEAFSRDLQRSSYSKGNNLLGLNIANEEACLTILGEPAVGKTTFLKYIGMEALYYPESRYKHDVLPVFLHLWKFCHNDDTLLQAIAEEFEKCGFPEPQELAIWMLEQGKLLILIDGLNESPLSQKYLSNHLRDFVKAYPKNRYIVSSRLASYQSSLGQFLELELQTWDDLHVQEYIHKWFMIAYESRTTQEANTTNAESARSEQDVASEEAQRCWKILQLNSVARDLANSPLCLSFLCLLCDRRYSLPSNVSGLYQKAINLVLEEQVLKCQLLNDQANNIISTDILDILLSEIAYKSFEIRQSLLPLQDLTEYLQQIIFNYMGVINGVEVDFILKVLRQIGICKINASGNSTIFLFSHITFQEYFVARYIYNHHKIKLIVPQYLSDRRWQNIFLLLAGMAVGNAEELLLAIELQTSNYINTNKLRDILDWIELINLNSKGELKSVAKRIAAIFLARPRFLPELAPALILTRILGLAQDLYKTFDLSLNFDKIFAADLSLSLAHALDFDSATELNLAIQLCSELEQSLAKIDFDKKNINFMALNKRLESLASQSPSYDQSFEVRETFRNQISRTWLQTLYLPMELNQISHQEVEALENYLYANLLMVQCKNRAIAVSRKTWEQIESRMLRIIGS